MSRPPQSPDPEADALAEFERRGSPMLSRVADAFDAFLAEQEAERQFHPGRLMRAEEIIAGISWSPETDPSTIQQIEDAILKLDAKSRQSNHRPVISEMGLYRCLELFVERAGSAKAAAVQLGISPSFLSQIRHAGRPMPPAVVHKLGFQKKREFEGI